MQATMTCPLWSYRPAYGEIGRIDSGETAYSVSVSYKGAVSQQYPLAAPYRKPWCVSMDSRSIYNTLAGFAVDTSAALDNCLALEAEVAAYLEGGAVSLVPKRSMDATMEIQGRERGLATLIVDSDYF